MTFIKRYSTVARGGVEFIGNTLGLSKASNQLAAGTRGAIGAFTSLNPTQVATFPPGTTLDSRLNGSTATLALPAGSQILRAFLVWGGMFRVNATQIESELLRPVRLLSGIQNNEITPDPAALQKLTLTLSGQTLGYYSNTADVTAYIDTIQGQYSVLGVPALLVASDLTTLETCHAGWTLCVIYRNDILPLRDLTLWTGAVAVSGTAGQSGQTDLILDGFATPTELPITGKAFLSVQEGDSMIDGDQFYFGRDAGSLQRMSGPNNPELNFFASQINNSAGLLDQTGTFGTRNADPFSGDQVLAGRQGWDITAVDVSATLAPSQTQALLRFTSSGDLYIPNAAATQIDAVAAVVRAEKSASASAVLVGEEITYTVDLRNEGTVDAQSCILSDPLPQGVELVAGSITVDGQPSAQPSFPITIPTIAPAQTVRVQYRAKAAQIPIPNPAVNTAQVQWQYVPLVGVIADGSAQSNPVAVQIGEQIVRLNKQVDRAYASVGEVLTYTSVFTVEQGYAVEDTVFTDAIPIGTTLVADSVTVNGVVQAGANPATGIALGNLAVGQSVTVAFQVTIASGDIMKIDNISNVQYQTRLPDGQTLAGETDSNPVSTEVISSLFTRVKTSDKVYLIEGGRARQSVLLTNNSSIALQQMQFTDTMSAGAQYVAGSVQIDGVPYAGYDPLAGFAIGDLGVGASRTVSYEIQADLPQSQPQVTNFATLAYQIDDPIGGQRSISENTNTVILPVVSSRMEVVKQVDRAFAVAGDELTYTIVVTNRGQLPEQDLLFSDPIPQGVTFVTGSVVIDNVSYPSYNPGVGFALKNLGPSESTTVVFRVRVV